jgi:hypothetical protein
MFLPYVTGGPRKENRLATKLNSTPDYPEMI